jgi:HlyD family secretion protein
MSKAKKKKHTAAKVIVLCAAVAGAGTAGYLKYQSQTEATSSGNTQAYKEEKVQYGTVSSGITESGSVTFGSQEQEFSVAEIVEVSSSSSTSSSSGTQSSSQSGQSMGGNSMGSSMSMGTSGSSSSGSSSSSSGTETSLTVDEICVAVGQVVAEGDPILKIDADSIEDYRSELEAAVADAQLLVKQEEINVESKKAEADYTYAMYIAEGETAEETYNATITSLENAVADLEEELQESADAIAEYEEEQEAGEDVDDELEAEELNYSTIEANLQIAKNNLTTQSIEAKQTYENAMTNYKYADQLYEIDTNGLEDDLDDAKETLQDAEDALAEFEEEIGDGTIYSEYSGTVMSISYAEGDALSDESTILTFSDDENITMTVSVSQEDISTISVGDTASIALTAYSGESFPGEVTSISTSTSLGSSTVNYDVEVRFTGDTEKVYSGMTGEVTFVEKEASDVLYVSNRAVHQEGTRSYVKVKESDGTIKEVTVKTGFSNGSTVEITDGLEEGQTVLIESQVES